MQLNILASENGSRICSATAIYQYCLFFSFVSLKLAEAKKNSVCKERLVRNACGKAKICVGRKGQKPEKSIVVLIM